MLCSCIYDLVFRRRSVFTHVGETKAIEFHGIWVYVSFVVNRPPSAREESSLRKMCTVRKGKASRLCNAACHDNCVCISACSRQERTSRMYARAPNPSYRIDSRMKLSILSIFPIAAFVHPSSLMMASTSSLRGKIYSGWAASWKRACVKLCIVAL